MQTQYLIRQEAPQVPPYDAACMAQGLSAQLAHFLFPLLVELDRWLDKRLVRTFLQTVAVIVTFRDRVNGLLLSELGGYLLSPDQAPAGTKRLSNLLHSAKWTASLITRFLWQRASEQLTHWQQAGQHGLVIWDESSWEKPESRQLEDLGPTRSSKAARLTHIKPGYYSPPSAPIFVPGMQWLAVLLVGRLVEQGPPLLAAQRWWTNRGPHASFKRDEEGKLLVELAAAWGRVVIHVFDQGFASAFWLGVLLAYGLRFVLRWRKDYQLLDAAGNRRLTWKIAQGKRGWSQRWVWDARRARWVIATVLVLAVAHPDHPEVPLSLVVCRSQGRSPWYLLTADPIQTEEQAWGVVFAYMRRWQIELSWKYEKSELAFQSPRVYEGEAREKLLLLATLAYAFLLTLLNEGNALLRLWLLRYYAHRTGNHARAAKLPLTRLRCALSRLWQDQPPNFTLLGTSRTPIHVAEVI
ncbi:MAG TPA: hypothetical protein VFN02_11895 [Ktedonobacteraceae bacterium]|nr:hypothetical protein [Ktedonobacteraceae bacterium]